MTDRNGQPLKVGYKVTYDRAPGYGVGQVLSLCEFARVKFIGYEDEYCDPKNLTLVEPKPEPVGYKADGTPIDLGGIPVVTSEAVPEGYAWLVDTAKITEYLDSEEGQASLKEAFAKASKATAFINGKANTLMNGKVEVQTFKVPIPEPDYKGMLDEANEKLRNLTRAVTQYLTLVEPAVEHIGTNVFEALERPDGAELFAKAELVSRVCDIVGGFERSRFPEVADEILKAVAAYHG